MSKLQVSKALTALCCLFVSSSPFAEVKDAHLAAPQDVNSADKFLKSIASECGDSRAYASKDGRVTIKLMCNGQSKGVVVLKDGKIVGMK
jgi:hypothetical protein